MTPIRTDRRILRNWQERDRDLFERINADGFGFAAIEIAATGECAGFAGIMATDLEPHLPAGAIEIGWRLAPEFWGKGIVTEAADAWLDHAFVTLGLDEIVSYAVAINHRSTAVMRRIGMTLVPGAEFDHPKIRDSHPHLKRFVVYRITRAEWRKRKGAA